MERTHEYHARAHALAGRIEHPFGSDIPEQAPVSLLSTGGGYSSSKVGSYAVEGILSFDSAHTQVAGSISPSSNGWTTLVSSTVENVNVLNVVTADRAVAQILLEHPREGYVPKVSFIGTQFVNLRIGGYPVQAVIDLDFCDFGDPTPYPQKALIDDDRFHARVKEQYRKITDANRIPSWAKKKTVPNWIQKRFAEEAPKQLQEKSAVTCSLIREIRGEHPGYPYHHCIEVPEFGKIHLAELCVTRDTFELSMVRLELGCPVGGSAKMAFCIGNGTTNP